jgi:nucleotide-binding universal stress UspA family protein
MIRKILLGYDGSAQSQKALDAALDLAKQYKAELFILTVVQPPEFGDDVEAEAVIENSRVYHEKLLASTKPLVQESGVSTHYEVAVGHPAEQIVYYADRQDADLIVVGHRGRSKFARLLLGSVSKHVVQYAERQVLVVR